MKTNIFKLSLMALAAAFITSCSQDEELAMGAEQPNVLNISATVKEYTPDAETRVTDTEADADYTTSFENNDCIGVYVVVNGETVIANRQLKFDSSTGKWTPPTASDEPLYYYKDAQYIAYSPYNAELALASGEEKTIAEKIKDYFVGTVWTAEATKNDYSSCDLMIATYNTDNELPSTENVNAAFEFSHVMSMVEYWIPAKTYTTKADGTGYSYSGIPMSGLKFEMKAAADWEEVTPISIDGIRYRILLDPDAEENASMYFGGQFDDNGAPVYFRTENAFTPAAGTFKKVTVTRNGYSFEPTVRPIEVGDYYYSDGNIVPSSESTIPEKINGAECIGIVYSTDMAGTDTGKENGYVVALKSVDCKWDFGTTSEYISIGGEGGLTSTEFCAIKNGYTRTKLYNCSSFLETEFTKVTSTTSGWYIPAPAQFVEMLVNLGEYEPDESEDYNAKNSSARINAIKKLKSKIKAAGGSDFAEFTWMCMEPSSSNTWAFHSKESTNNPIFNGGRPKGNSYNLRPVFAF